jgi:hypothetical protein
MNSRGRGVEVAVRRALGVERIQVGHEVPAHAVGVDELEDAGLLLHLLAAPGRPEEAGVDVGLRAHGAVREAEVLEDPLVEPVLALEQPFHAREEEARLRALDDAVVVGRRHRHHLADAEEAQGARGHRAVLGRIVEGARGDDHALPRHQPGGGRGGAHGARVRERDGRAHEVVGRDRPLARPRHEVVEHLQEVREVELARVLDVGHEQGAAAVLLLDVDRDAEPDLVALDAVRPALELRVGVVQPGEGVEGAEDGPGHDVGEADLALARGVPVLVEDAAVLLQGAHGKGADRGRGGNVEARLHVLHHAEGAAADGLGDVSGKDGGDGHGLPLVASEPRLAARAREDGGPLRRRRGRGRNHHLDRRGCFLRDDPELPVEVVPPARLHRPPVLAVLLEEVEREDVVAAEVADQRVEERVGLHGAHGLG